LVGGGGGGGREIQKLETLLKLLLYFQP